jgi:putative Mn2+ efflux pump MntP
MSLFELFFIAVGLSMDAFAVAICTGLSMRRVS